MSSEHFFDMYVSYRGEVDRSIEKEEDKFPDATDPIDPWTKIKLLSIAQQYADSEMWRYNNAKDLCVEKVMGKRSQDWRQSEYQREVIDPYLRPPGVDKSEGLMRRLGLYDPSLPKLGTLPIYSALLQMPLRLVKPFLSKDDEPFYIHENPILRDKVFKVPMVRPSNWKGNLRAAMRWELGLDDSHETTIRLFGNQRGEEQQKRLRSGRLRFFPTFFDGISVGVINPHSRETRAGINPIPLEMVPPEASGLFTLLYVPFDCLEAIHSPNEGEAQATRKEIARDIEATCRSVAAMLLKYGFSAKKTSGYGVVEDQFGTEAAPEGLLRMNGVEGVETQFHDCASMQAIAEQIAVGVREAQ